MRTTEIGQEFSIDLVVLKEIEKSDYLDIRMSCGELSTLIPGLERTIEEGKNTGLIAYHRGMAVGAIIGMLDFEKSMDAPLPLPCVRVYFLEVNRQFQGKGIGKLLMTGFLEKMKEKSIGFVFIDLYKNFKKGVHFFEKYGFQKIKVERNKIVLKLVFWDDLGVVNNLDMDD
ncbi:MAG: GNAT family N-acetyltransferase [Promethearchaeota archaeon]